VVEAVGPGVTRLAVGDHVVLTPSPACGHCYWCVRGEHAICADLIGLFTATFPDGSTRLSRGGETVYRGLNVGAFAETVITQEAGAIKIDEDVPLEVACVVGCAVQTGVGAVLNTAKVPEGATVLVMGLGGVGLSVVQGARLAAAARVIAVDPLAERRETALRLGATDVLDPTESDVVAAALDLTGVGVDYAFEAAGKGALAAACVNATRSGGTTVLVGAPGLDENLELGPAVIFGSSEKKLLGCILGSSHAPRDLPRYLDLWRAGRLDLEALITGTRPLDEINEAFADLTAGTGVRTVLTI
jgi:Zn-dependent alcohol dehydrogenase